MHINELIAHHGACFYGIAFLWTFLEGETIILFAGVAAAQGLLNPFLLLGSAWLGSFCGDQCYFWLGRQFGVALLNRFPRFRSGVDTALHWLERYNTGFILSFRFIYGVRNFSSFAMGLSAVHWKRFLALNLLAAALWAAVFVGLGYFLGHALRAMLGDVVRTFSLGMLGVFVLIMLGMWLLHRVQRRFQPPVPRGVKAVVPPP
ncbi:MAG TPA: DedA family protein [Stellaceae bacterium]|nr:DedA family protein [Stellaceae bacterium]